MRRGVALLLLTLAGSTARADEPPRPAAAPPAAPAPAAPAPAATPAAQPLAPEQAADAVLAAVNAKDDAALKALAARDDPDPWLVADELIRRSEFDPAKAFAAAAPRVDTEKLPAYVASRRGKLDDVARRARLVAANAALQAGKFADALEVLGVQESGPIDDVIGVRREMGRGIALASLVRLDASAAAYLAAGDAAERIGWLERAARAFDGSGMSASRGSAFAAARGAWERTLSICERRGNKVGTAATLVNIGRVYHSLGNYAKALSMQERGLAAMEALEDKAGAASTLGNIGLVHASLGNYPQAQLTFARALAAMEALGDEAGAAFILGAMGGLHGEMGDYAQAISEYERALAVHDALGDKTRAAQTLVGLGNANWAVGDYPKALATYGRALAAFESLGEKKWAATTLGNIGLVYLDVGAYARAFVTQERALAAFESLGDGAGAATALINIGAAYASIGDYPKALATEERALAAEEALGNKAGAARAMASIASLYASIGDYPRALATYDRTLAAMEALGAKSGAATTLGNVGDIYQSLGDHTKALAMQERALSAHEALGDRAGAARTLGNIGNTYSSLGDYARALSTLERALAAKQALGDKAGAAVTLGNIGGVHDALGDHAKAMAFERQAVVVLSSLARGLGAEEGALAREPLSFVFDVGAGAAIAAKNASELTFFVESGRAVALIDGLMARETLWAVAVPEDLRFAEAAARAAEASAMNALRNALDGGDRVSIRARRSDLDATRERVSASIARIQREAEAGAALVYPEVASLDAIQATLAEGDVLILFALLEKEASALVVTNEAARIVALGPTAPLADAAEALTLYAHGVDSAPALATLAQRVVVPLGLSATTKRVFVSPAPALSYVPFAALLPDRTVVYVPSGTTYRLLREEASLRGEGVLALGDPDYATKVDERALAVHRGAVGRLAPLPGTRAEVEAFGDVKLLAGRATEAGLREALATRARWRAVHLACHGLVDTERPALSSLAITAAGDDDGFLTCLDVFRMRVPTDLVVLSACETGRGRLVKSEGIVGLTRAFMFAGAPRVICSLWKVDDDATRALMVKFYELWNPKDGTPGLPTAEALRKAQEFVKSQEKWAHPYYWAAWVLWGLPD